VLTPLGALTNPKFKPFPELTSTTPKEFPLYCRIPLVAKVIAPFPPPRGAIVIVENDGFGVNDPPPPDARAKYGLSLLAKVSRLGLNPDVTIGVVLVRGTADISIGATGAAAMGLYSGMTGAGL
jgi:hypothetical protein